MGWYNEALIKRSFGIPEQIRIIGITPLGYPDQEPKPRPRKELSEIAYYDAWPGN
jgi:nitroreductase